MKLRNPFTLGIAAILALGSACFGGGHATNYVLSEAAVAPSKIAAQTKKARNIISGAEGVNFALTPYKTTGNRAQRARQLHGMMARNGR
jgi:hypothetical protein